MANRSCALPQTATHGDGRGIPSIGERCSQNAVDAAQHLTFVTFGQHEIGEAKALVRDVVAGPRVEIADEHLLIPLKITFEHG
jgi:hypothetical protein